MPRPLQHALLKAHDDDAEIFSDVQNQSGCVGCTETAGATGPAREGRPRHSETTVVDPSAFVQQKSTNRVEESYRPRLTHYL